MKEEAPNLSEIVVRPKQCPAHPVANHGDMKLL